MKPISVRESVSRFRLALRPKIFKFSPPPTHFSSSFFSLHTYLVGVLAIKNAGDYDSSPTLHIVVARVVQSPSGAWPAEFLLAFSNAFHRRCCLGHGVEEEIVT